MTVRAISAAVSVALMCSGVHADSVNQNFNVTVNLTQKCIADSSNGSPALNFGTYTAFGSASTASPSALIKFQCTRGISTPTFTFDTGTLASATGNSGTGVIAGLTYSISGSGLTKSSTGNAATTSADGTPDIYSTTITGSMATGQAGCASGPDCASTQARTLMLAF